jgi:hypothetical protein
MPRSLPFLEAARESVRAGLAFVFAIIFFVTIMYAFLSTGTDSWDDTKELLQILLPAETALLGSAVGFYFGTRR